MSRRRQRGMTLIEVMLALALFAMLSLFVFGIMNSVLGLWQTGERRGSGDLAFAAAVERLRSDLGALHTGPRGWLILDDYEARPAEGDQPPWRLPRLRFLAHGGSLPADDPSGRKAVEVAWVLVPSDPSGDTRLTSLMRLSRIEDGDAQFDDERGFSAAMRAGGGIPMLDGVLWADFVLALQDGEEAREHLVPAESPLDFPVSLDLRVERVGQDALKRPVVLDNDLGASGTRMVLRGTAPLAAPSHVQIDQEWIAVNGSFPRFGVVERAARNTNPSDHRRGTRVFIPEIYDARATLAANGRRVRL